MIFVYSLLTLHLYTYSYVRGLGSLLTLELNNPLYYLVLTTCLSSKRFLKLYKGCRRYLKSHLDYLYVNVVRLISMETLIQFAALYHILRKYGGWNSRSFSEILFLKLLLSINSVNFMYWCLYLYNKVFSYLTQSLYARMTTWWLIEAVKQPGMLFLLSKLLHQPVPYFQIGFLVLWKVVVMSIYWRKESHHLVSQDSSGQYWEKLLMNNLSVSGLTYSYNLSYRVPKGFIRPDFVIYCGLNRIVLDAKNVWAEAKHDTVNEAVKEMLYRNYSAWIPFMVKSIVLLIPDNKTDNLMLINQELRDIKLPIIAITGYESWLIYYMMTISGVSGLLVLIILFKS